MANTNEIVLDTYVPEISGFSNQVPDQDNEPLRLRTYAGAIYISGRKVTIPTQIYTYAPNSDTYEDLILNLNTSLVGDGLKSTFTILLASPIRPILYSTVKVTDGIQLLTDVSTDMLDAANAASTDSYIGSGIFRGDGVGTVNYNSGELTFTFSKPPASGAPIEVSWVTINRIPVVSGTTPPNRTLNSTRLQVVKTGESSITSAEVIAKTDWDRPVFLTGRIFQAREANEIVSILTDKIRSIGNSIFNDGDFVAGSQLSVSDEYLNANGLTERAVEISTGLYYIQGCVRSVPGQVVYITGQGNETVGLRVIRSLITEDLNKDLKDISTGWDGSGLPGAYRERVEIQWRANDPEATTVFEFVNGSALNVPVVTNFSKINDVLAHRTFLESGNYKVNGFRPSFTPIVYRNSEENETGTIRVNELEDDLALWLNFDSGTAFVEGYEVFKPQTSRVRWLKARGTRVKSGITFDYKPVETPNKEIYPLNNTPIASISSVKGYAKTPLMRVTGNNLIDNSSVEGLPGISGSHFTGILANSVKIFTTSTAEPEVDTPDYEEGTDFSVSQNVITWDEGVDPPSTPYYAVWSYDTSAGDFPLVKGTRILKKEIVTLTTSNSSDYEANKENIRRIVKTLTKDGVNLKDLAKYFRVYTDESGNPPNTEFTFGVDYKIKLGRSETSTDVDAKLIWKRKGRRPAPIGDDASTYYVEVYRWTHDVALYSAPTWLTDIDVAACAEGDYVGADSYLEELPDPIPVGYNGSQIQFPNAPSGAPYTSKRYRVIYQVPGYRNSAVEGERETKNRNSIDFRPLGVSIGTVSEEKIRRSLAPETTITCDYYYFQPRYDSVRLRKNGEFDIIYGENGSQIYPSLQSDRTLPLIQIYSKANSRYPRVTDTSVYRSTMQDIQSLKTRVNRLEVDFITTALEQDAIASSGSQLLRGVFTDPFRNFDHVDLDYYKKYEKIDADDIVEWADGTTYFHGDIIKVEDGTSYFKCIRSGVSAETEPVWDYTPGSITSEPNNTETPVWQAIGFSENPLEYPNNLSQLSETPIDCDIAISNLSGSIKFPSHIDSIRLGRKWPAGYNMESWGAEVAKSSQLIMLPWSQETKLTQIKSTHPVEINPSGIFDPPLMVSLDPPADYLVDLEKDPIINTTLPGSGVENRSGQYGDDSGSADDIGDSDTPVHPLPERNPYGRLDEWCGQFHFGTPADAISINTSIAPGTRSPIDKNGSSSDRTGFGIPADMLGYGFDSDLSKITSSTNFENVGNIVVSNALTRYIHERTIRITGKGFPAATDISVYFNDEQVDWILEDGSTSQTIKSLSNSSNRGSVLGTIRVPKDTPSGKHEISLRANNSLYIGRATYIAQGHMEQTNTNWSSALTIVNDLRSSVTPMAQGFTAKQDGYLSGVVLYFADLDENLSIEVQIREMINGIPGRTVLGKSLRRLGAEETATTKLRSNNAMVGASFYFEDPVFLEQGNEYCICLVTDSTRYRIWTADVGLNSIEDGTIITRSSEVGRLFISFNGLTWSSSPNSMLKFNLVQCRFTKRSVTVDFPEIDSMVGGSFILGATSLLPTGSQIKWHASIDGSAYFPIRPNITVNVNDVWRGLKLRAELIAAINENGLYVSPCINYQHMGVFSSTPTGRWYRYESAGADIVETNYISENVEIGYSIEQLKVFTEEFRKQNHKVEMYFSTDNGDTWVSFANSSLESGSINSPISYSSTDLGGSSNMYDVVRSYTMPFVDSPPSSAPANLESTTTTGGTLTVGETYYFKYTFVTATGESNVSTSNPHEVTIGSGHNSITFNLPTGSSFPENSDYPNGPTRLTNIKIYMGLTPSGLSLLEESSFDAVLEEGGEVAIKSFTLDPDGTSPPEVNTTQPNQFKIRIRMIAPKEEDLVPNITADDPVFGDQPMVVTEIADSGGLIEAGTYYLRYAWTTEFGETRPSAPGEIEIEQSSSSLYFKFSETEDNVLTPSLTFPSGARGFRIYTKDTEALNQSWLYGLVKVEVRRNGVIMDVDEVLVTDEYVSLNGYRLKNIAWWDGGDETTLPAIKSPVQYNTTGGLIKSSPQVAKLRVIAVDEL